MNEKHAYPLYWTELLPLNTMMSNILERISNDDWIIETRQRQQIATKSQSEKFALASTQKAYCATRVQTFPPLSHYKTHLELYSSTLLASISNIELYNESSQRKILYIIGTSWYVKSSKIHEDLKIPTVRDESTNLIK